MIRSSSGSKHCCPSVVQVWCCHSNVTALLCEQIIIMMMIITTNNNTRQLLLQLMLLLLLLLLLLWLLLLQLLVLLLLRWKLKMTVKMMSWTCWMKTTSLNCASWRSPFNSRKVSHHQIHHLCLRQFTSQYLADNQRMIGTESYNRSMCVCRFISCRCCVATATYWWRYGYW